ncbi:Hypothetical protein FKW44_002943, partial [Caligus rogercresseyi]
LWTSNSRSTFTHCHLQKATSETAIQISDTQFVHFLPHKETSLLSCRNGSTFHKTYVAIGRYIWTIIAHFTPLEYAAR